MISTDDKGDKAGMTQQFIKPSMTLGYDFYNRYVVDVAKELLGKRLAFGSFQGIITETEAYRGIDDEASHAHRGMTKRSSIMFGPAGYTYVYVIYGMYYCLNIVTEEVGQASAVLIRGLKLPEAHLDGPGKLCRHLGITKDHNGINVIQSDLMSITSGILLSDSDYTVTPRVGIRKATDKQWRFVMNDNSVIQSFVQERHMHVLSK
jgi:DNA-3-methyladenine glycosylase